MKTIVVKTVNGYDITRRENERGHFEVTIKSGITKNGRTYRTYQTFRTIKSAVEYIEQEL